jgi:hypothetical protein
MIVVLRAMGLNTLTFGITIIHCNQILKMGGGGLEPSPLIFKI